VILLSEIHDHFFPLPGNTRCPFMIAT